VRSRDAAARLGLSERELLVQGWEEEVVALRPDWNLLFERLPALGRVMALTRNDAVVHEREGTFNPAEFFGRMGQVVGADIDLRLFPACWDSLFAVTSVSEQRRLHSLQLFDAEGTALHKIFVRDEAHLRDYQRLVADLAVAYQPSSPPAPAPAATATPQGEVDVAAFLRGWDAMVDTHDFFPLLKRFGLTREAALQMAGTERARLVDRRSYRTILERAAADERPIMVFVGNRGVIQIHTGPVRNLRQFGEWFNVLDPEFNLHLHEPQIARSWVVRKPTRDGYVHSLEIFGEQGEEWAYFFGARKPGKPQDPWWEETVTALG